MIQEGDKIYEIEYDNNRFTDVNKRHIRSYIIKEFKSGIIYVKGTAWKIPFENIGHSYFLSKQACIMGAIKNNLKASFLTEDVEAISETCQEVRALCRMLMRIENKE